ncbi:MAG: aminotransferase class I/II-fold pyridoxal phosphate-dependent enzyme [Candidatus Gastranaerophilales bacterium]|nr:aminotransferase class I/II-fold pyridoxal phosphate-dependent enzyme [Candidatus Gastranaerophilales bacterium]
MYITDALIKISDKKPVLFTTSGHCQGNQVLSRFNFLNKAFKYDFSEIDGLDNLQNPEGIILESQKWASEIYESGQSYYLVNGSSSGILALMLSTAGVGEKVLIARNAHKSVINALVLSGAVPVWIDNDWLYDWDILAGMSLENIEKAFAENPDVKGIWLTNPTYEGIVSDITPISKFCKEKGIFLIVDEAHGALWNFSDRLSETAIKQGADASVQSLHKTAASLNQGALLHLSKNSKIDSAKLQQCLNIVNTTSPSYLILASIEGSIEYLNTSAGRKRLDCLIEESNNFRQNLSSIGEINFLEAKNNFQVDKTKLFFGIKNVSGYALGDLLLEKFNIEVELDNNKGILALTGIGTERNKFKKLSDAVIKSANILKKVSVKNISSPFIKPEMVYTPREAFYKRSVKSDLKDCIGKISKQTIVPYPPGIPVLIAGELIRQEHIDIIKDRDKIEIIAE